MKKILIIKLIYIIILIILLILIFFFKLRKKQTNFKFINEKYDSRNDAFKKAIDFIKSCLSPTLFEFESKILLKKPMVSVVIPMFNCQKYILRSVKSVQSQNISDIEILLVDDKSKDNTISLVKKMQNRDNRIIIIKNQKNMGILYSRSIGVLFSKGKYLFTLDNDDIFLYKDIFYTTIILAQSGNFDIIEFKAISNKIKNEDLLNNKIKDAKFTHQKSVILFQPELGRFPISTGNTIGSYRLRDIFLWGKCIKTKIYKKVLNKLEFSRYSRYMIRYEDIIINYAIFNIAESFLNIQKYGIYHLERLGSGVSLGWFKVPRNINLLYLIDIVIDFSQNNINNKKLAIHLVIYYLNLRKIERTLASNKYNMKLIISCIQRILNSKYTSENNKIFIKNIAKRLKFMKSFGKNLFI